MEKPCISRPIIVEGKYDKIKLDSLFSAYIIPTDGFALFKKAEKRTLLRRLAERSGVIVLTDADGGGRQIRSFLSELLPKDRVTHLYIPAVKGKEKRKEKAGKAGLLGVEGIEADTLRAILAPYVDGAPPKEHGGITTYLGIGTDTTQAVHNDEFDLDEECIPAAIDMCMYALDEIHGM